MGIVTKRGDKGDTGLLYGGRVPKDDPRVEAYGTVDEAVSALGLARALSTHGKVKEIVLAVQKELFTLGAELATDVEFYDKFTSHFSPVTAQMVEKLETYIAELEKETQMPTMFVVPGASPASAALDLARTIIRRAERRAVGLKNAGLVKNQEIIRYLNRLSDLVYELGRYENKESGPEVPVGKRT